jgi:hypothetical protein
MSRCLPPSEKQSLKPSGTKRPTLYRMFNESANVPGIGCGMSLNAEGFSFPKLLGISSKGHIFEKWGWVPPDKNLPIPAGELAGNRVPAPVISFKCDF